MDCMNREILFKAKRKDNGKWIEGYYQRRYDDFGNIEHLIFYSKSPVVWGYVEIDETTLCQYTGEPDKKGNKLWENDEVLIHAENLKGKYVCFWDECNFEYGFKNEKESFGIAYISSKDVEVIGNVFDDQDLTEAITMDFELHSLQSCK